MPQAPEPTGSPFGWAEQTLASRAVDDLPVLALANDVAHLAGLVLQSFTLPYTDPAEQDDRWFQTKALVYLGILAARSLRLVMLTVEHGYEAEAIAMKRRLDEVHARTDRVLNQTSGAQRAREWLQGRDGKPGKIVELPPGAWALHSHLVHADYRAVEHHLIQRHDDGTVNFALLPLRDSAMSNAILTMACASARDVVVQIAGFVGTQVSGLDVVDRQIREALAQWVVPGEAGAPSYSDSSK